MTSGKSEGSDGFSFGFESWIKTVGIVVTVGTFAFGVIKYVDSRPAEIAAQQLQAKAAERQSKAAFFRQQADLYFEAVAVAAKLATMSENQLLETTQSTGPSNPLKRFLELYWGELGTVEDGAVEYAMVRFGMALESKLLILSGRSIKEPLKAGKVRKCAKNLNTLSLTLGHCIRRSLENSWDVEDFLTYAPTGMEAQQDRCRGNKWQEMKKLCESGLVPNVRHRTMDN